MKWINCKPIFIGLSVVLLITLPVMGQEHQKKEQKARFIEGQHDPVVQPAFWWSNSRTLLIGVGDSLTQGTRDATNNKINTENAYLQLVYNKLKKVKPLKFSQPFLNEDGNRLKPFTIPTNLGVDGEDIFSVEGIEYAPRDGDADENYVTDEYLCNRLQPYFFADMHDKVLYPINLWAGQPVSQFDALIWRLNNRWRKPAWVIFWIGNNDAALASLGLGGKNPEYLPIPFRKIEHKLKPGVRWLLNFGEYHGVLSFAPYTSSIIQNSLTTPDDFQAQFNHLQNRLKDEANLNDVEFFLLTFPHYPEVGYLMDAGDLVTYLNKANPAYPDSLSLDGRVSLLTFMCMYALLKSESTVEEVNEILDDGSLVLSDTERTSIEGRIDEFNDIVTAAGSDHVHIIDIGAELNGVFSGTNPLLVGYKGKTFNFTRNWGWGHAFSFDGVHAGYTAHAFIANKILIDMLGLENDPRVGPYDLSKFLVDDPYVDWDGDGWVEGPDYKASGRTKILFLFKDYQEGVPGDAVIDTMSATALWELISDALLEEVISIPLLKLQAERMGLVPIKEINQ